MVLAEFLLDSLPRFQFLQSSFRFSPTISGVSSKTFYQVFPGISAGVPANDSHWIFFEISFRIPCRIICGDSLESPLGTYRSRILVEVSLGIFSIVYSEITHEVRHKTFSRFFSGFTLEFV